MKRRKSRRNVIGSSSESVDRISDLPDSILGIILSFLPTTKNAVSTAILSKRWNRVWTMVHNLDFDFEDSLDDKDYYEDSLDEQDDMRFIGCVNRVLRLHDAGWLNKFRLVWKPRCISSHGSTWITTAVSKNVNELSLSLETRSIYVRDFSDYYTFVMPTSVFTCDTLRILELDGGIYVSESIAVCLPRLETIKLESVYFQSEEAFEKLIRGCPVLINLRMKLVEFFENDGFTYIISSTSLRRLEIDIRYIGGSTEPGVYCINMELEAISLEYLLLNGFIPVFVVRKSLSSLVEAKLDVEFATDDFSDVDLCNSVVDAVRVFDCAKALFLSGTIIWALSCATISLSTEFKRLVKLEATTYSFACSSLRDFIGCSPNLEVLMLDEVENWWEDIELDPPKWIAPVQVPKCLSNRLWKLVIKGSCAAKHERGMVCYMLKHGVALVDIQISFNF